jgi:citrate synthase
MKWLDAETACALLGIKPASLYAYVSRGLVRARPSDNDTRASLYAGADIDQLLSRKRASRKRDSIARGAIGWGEPILESAITTVQDGRLIFRGYDAITLSKDQTLEQVASLLWGGGGLPFVEYCTDAIIQTDSKSAGLAYLAQAAATAKPCVDPSKDDLAYQAASLLEGFSHAVALGTLGAGAHNKLANLWKLTQSPAEILRQALVLLADHELNPSTFAARIAASTGASLPAAALAGFATLTGPYHGEAAATALDYLALAHRLGPQRAATAFLERGEILLGLGHKLYPDGDPRARALLAALAPYPLLHDAICEAECAWGAPANIDMALAALTIALGLPKTAPFILFANARIAGWLAHAAEQGLLGAQIRPRARYVGAHLGSKLSNQAIIMKDIKPS